MGDAWIEVPKVLAGKCYGKEPCKEMEVVSWSMHLASITIAGAVETYPKAEEDV